MKKINNNILKNILIFYINYIKLLYFDINFISKLNCMK